MQGPGFRIKDCWLFTAIDEQNIEGLIGASIKGQWMPFVCADPDRVESLMEIAKHIAKDSRRQVRLLKFSNLEIVSDNICE